MKLKPVIGFLYGILFCFLGSTLGHAQEQEVDAPLRGEEWSQECIDLLASLPVLDGGRVKPMSSYAGLRLLMLNGKRSLKLESGEKLTPASWCLDVIFFPEDARKQRVVRVQNDAVLVSVGIVPRKKSDRYSYDELLPARNSILERAQAILEVEASERSAVERLTLKLHIDLNKFDGLLASLAPLRLDFDLSGAPRLAQIFGKPRVTESLEVFDHLGELSDLMRSEEPELDGDRKALRRLLGAFDRALARGRFGPPLAPSLLELQPDENWWTVEDIYGHAFEFNLPANGEHLQLLRRLTELERVKLDRALFTERLKELHGQLVAMAEARGDYSHVEQEIMLYRLDPFTRGLYCFVLGFLLYVLSLLFGNPPVLNGAIWGLGLLGFGALVFGIVMRSVIRERPPVVSLYDTILFVTAVVVLVTFIVERLLRLRVAQGIGLLLGVSGLFLAMKYELVEIAEVGDTMRSVQAVLNTNYYLAIHVTTVAIGYSGGLLASGIGVVWILGRFFRLREDDAAYHKSVTRMIYGTLCFSLLFALFGTAMGGVWANDSWGRFWGWDPKENGALLICLWLLLTLHMRLGGYIRDRGIAVMAVLAGAVVAASWWGVNLLGVGLHSYGFTSGVAQYLYIFWGILALVLWLSLLDATRRQAAQQAQKLGD